MPHPLITEHHQWQLISDQVMGGCSTGAIQRTSRDQKTCLQLTGTVSLDNNGGFLQMRLDLTRDGQPFDASAYRGLILTACGNGQPYAVHLKTADMDRPWQSYRHAFTASPTWQTLSLPFSAFLAHRTEQPLNPTRLTRIGIVAIGHAFDADIAVAELTLGRY